MIKSGCSDEIAENMLNILKEASGIISWENFKISVDNAKTCSDLQNPYNWIETGKCVMFQEQAEQYFQNKKAVLCK
jgi:hypothetical protein